MLNDAAPNVPLAELMAIDFAAHDLSLYLDTRASALSGSYCACAFSCAGTNAAASGAQDGKAPHLYPQTASADPLLFKTIPPKKPDRELSSQPIVCRKETP